MKRTNRRNYSVYGIKDRAGQLNILCMYFKRFCLIIISFFSGSDDFILVYNKREVKMQIPEKRVSTLRSGYVLQPVLSES